MENVLIDCYLDSLCLATDGDVVAVVDVIHIAHAAIAAVSHLVPFLSYSVSGSA